MSLIKKTDEEIIKIATPLWDELVKASNMRDYSGFTKNFSALLLTSFQHSPFSGRKFLLPNLHFFASQITQAHHFHVFGF